MLQGNGGLPYIMTHLNAKEASLPSSFSGLSSLSLLSAILFPLWCRIISPFSLFLFFFLLMLLLMVFLFSYHPIFICVVISAIMQLHGILKVKISFPGHFCPLKACHPQRVWVMKNMVKIDVDCNSVCELMKLYFTKLFCICVMKHSSEVCAQGIAKLSFLSKPISSQWQRSTKDQIRICVLMWKETDLICPLQSVWQVRERGDLKLSISFFIKSSVCNQDGFEFCKHLLSHGRKLFPLFEM